MTGFIEGESRAQATLFPERLDDYISESNPVRVIDVFVDELDLGSLSFKTVPEDTGRPPYHPAALLKIYLPFLTGQHPSRTSSFPRHADCTVARVRVQCNII
jgi:hypothetical protein